MGSGEVFAYPEGFVNLWASASGTTTGSGLAYLKNATMTFAYGWQNRRNIAGTYYNLLTGQRVDVAGTILFADTQLFRLANASAAINAEFRGSGGAGVSAQFLTYSGNITQFAVTQTEDDLFAANFSYYANSWSAFGQ